MHARAFDAQPVMSDRIRTWLRGVVNLSSYCAVVVQSRVIWAFITGWSWSACVHHDGKRRPFEVVCILFVRCRARLLLI